MDTNPVDYTGLITAIAALITAIGGVIAAVRAHKKADFVDDKVEEVKDVIKNDHQGAPDVGNVGGN